MAKTKKKGTVGFVSLGCPKNQTDTEVMLRLLADAGYEITPEEIEADVVVINTCAFIESAKRESIDSIIDIGWLKKNRSLKGIVVAGCLAERYPDEIERELPEADAIIGVGSCHRIVEAVDAVMAGSRYRALDDKETCPLGGERVITTDEGMAYLKIAEGCDNRCTYCTIPMIRGKMRSREMDDIVKEAKSLCEIGVKEIILVAQDVTAYGKDLYGGYVLHTLLHRLAEETDVKWLRLMYCYPDKLTDELIAEIRDNDKVVKYIDIPVQHISDKILRRMNRRGDGALIRSLLQKLRQEVPGISIRTTAIVGFPGETDEDFSELCTFVKEFKFEHFGAFTYSREEDTPAYDFEDQVDEDVKEKRYDILMRTQLQISEKLCKKQVGKTKTVICEGFDAVSESYFGRSDTDAPDVDGKVYFTADRKVAAGEFVDVKITEALDYDLVGHVVTKK